VVAAAIPLLFLGLQPAGRSPEGYSFREASAGAWQLVLNGQTVAVVTPGPQVLVVDPFDNKTGAWRKPAMEARKAAPDSTIRQVYLNFLKKRYGYQIQAINRAYGLDASSFTELESETFAATPTSRMLADDAAFTADWLEERLAKGPERKAGQIRLLVLPDEPVPEALLETAGRFVDGFAIRNPAAHSDIRKPVLRMSSHCGPSAVEPRKIAACLRISNP
jgi:hypothetical protein